MAELPISKLPQLRRSESKVEAKDHHKQKNVDDEPKGDNALEDRFEKSSKSQADKNFKRLAKRKRL